MAPLTVDEVVARAPAPTPEQVQILRGLLPPVHGRAEPTEHENERRAS